ncbi:ribosomal-protein-alanine N-acetyltransferase [Sphingobium fontiphilum]|uniref:Ribosomal-protein-alanine N-acetyltransferase n=1 Tax=Sphingobium fontiphilum TaxID=944425 RepID=A0A7W6DDG9_9SPHN|nr:GNAT family N-acetyltransferase [Sphingobium fontiphilum]MBB3980707.1 ribosomal-protein-alanine N-acetyltransferase [Sphingobium fontiphilum]
MIAGLALALYENGDRLAVADAMAVMPRAFDPAFGEAWTTAQLTGIMSMPGTWLTIARIDAAPIGFALVRSVLDECELLLLAVDPAWGGKGVGTSLLQHSINAAKQRRITSMNLEVRATNKAVILYEKMGFEFVYRRPGYYRGNDNQLYDALSFRKDMNL